MSTKSDQPRFSKNEFLNKLRYAVWPIQSSELKKFLPLGLMMSMVIFIYYAARCTKDAAVVSKAGAEAIPFLKTFGVVPFSVLFFIIFAKLTNKLSREKVFYVVISAFIIFFASFALLIYPNHEALHPSAGTVKSLQEAVPFMHLIFELFGSWTGSIFYIMAELWGSVALSLLFWQFANQITRTREAVRFYAMFPLVANAVLIPGGWLIGKLSLMGEAKGRPQAEAWGISLYYLMAAVVIAGIVLMVAYWWMNKKVLTDPAQYDEAETKPKKEKLKLSLGESFKMIAKSPYLLAIALIVLCYGITINLVEITWKSQLKLQFPDEISYNAFMGEFTSYTGAVTLICILLTKGVVRKFGWFVGAVLTPIVVLITGVLFYAFVIFRGELSWLTAAMGATPVLMAVVIGTAQNLLSKGTKYSLFDPTKEMSYIPLDPESKSKGKAAVDVIGGRFGKSGGSMIQIVLFSIAGAGASAIAMAPIFAGLMVAMCIAWIFAAKRLGRMYTTKLKDQEIESLKEKAKETDAITGEKIKATDTRRDKVPS